jgi:hypothetical protein
MQIMCFDVWDHGFGKKAPGKLIQDKADGMRNGTNRYACMGPKSQWWDEEDKLMLTDQFSKLKSHVSLTADLWSSNQNLGYLGVTTH